MGLTPTLDEDSIKVEGTGSATISDISVDLVANLELFEDHYPSEEDDSDSLSDFDAEDKPDFGYDGKLEALEDQVTLLNDEQARAREKIASADRRLKILDSYGNSLDKKRNVVIEQGLDTYREEREKVFLDHQEGSLELRRIQKELKDVEKERIKVARLEGKEKKKWAKGVAKRSAAHTKLAERREAKRRDKKREKERIKKERATFWPKFHYTATITLDASAYTPVSSRRSSVASEADLQLLKEKDQAAGAETGESSSSSAKCDLLITYVTSSAFWAPSYDLQLSTINNTANLSFEAKLTNTTSETWRNAKIILSTSQTTFAGLEDALPTLVPWHVKLGNRTSGVFASDILHSREERKEQVDWEIQRHKHERVQKPRAELFGLWENEPGGALAAQQAQNVGYVKNRINMAQQAQLAAVEIDARNALQPDAYRNKGPVLEAYSKNISASIPPPPALARAGSVLKSKKKRGSSSFTPTAYGATASARRGGPGGWVGGGGGGGGDSSGGEEEEADGAGDGDGDDKTMLEDSPELDFQDSAMEETGLTTTYDLPGQRTLAPRSRASKQRIARINFSNVVFNHTVVAKYKPVAYLKAKLRNASKLTLLRGPAGLTVDGSFMGRTRLPRCSAGESFVLSLGIDPAIRVVYPKPEVRRSTSGLFSKEDSSIYTRTVTITNTKATAGKVATLYVLDQVPISEDERLRVDILSPRGLVSGGSAVASGVPGREGSENKDWGKATALLRKGNEISWEVNLKAGKSVKLTLDYEIAAPAGEHVIQC